MLKRISSVVFSIVLGLGSVSAQNDMQTADSAMFKNYKAAVYMLASDSFKGREAGSDLSRGLVIDYLYGKFNSIGLKPYNSESFVQPFPFIDGGEYLEANNNLLVGDKKLMLVKDYYPLSYSANGNIKSEIVYVGYGIIANNLGYDDYKGMTPDKLKGKIFVMEISTPDNSSESKYKDFIDLQKKIDIAVTNGAAAIIFINTEKNIVNPSKVISNKISAGKIPIVFVNGESAQVFKSKKPVKVELNVTVERLKKTGYNFIGYIDNNAPTTVVIGAHYDHWGFGTPDYKEKNPPAIHNGANDNASGVAGMFEVAKYIKNSNLKANNYMFIAFDAEEKGALGSSYFVKSDLFTKANVNYMVCLDMIGGLDPEKKSLMIIGTGTSAVFDNVIDNTPKLGMNIVKSPSGAGGSDNTSFYIKNIPVLFFNSGDYKKVYHTPKDKADIINYEGSVSIIKFAENVISQLDSKGKLTFIKTQDAEMTKPGNKMSIGAKPDIAFQGKGFKVEFVIDGQSAAKAGIKEGDIITKIGEYDINDMRSYGMAMTKFKKGDKTKVVFIRGTETLTKDLEF